MAEFGKWTSAIEDPPKEVGIYLIRILPYIWYFHFYTGSHR